MFHKYYGMRDQPFGVTPDPRNLFLSGTHREALASLFCGIESGRGFMALIAKPGMGKTTLLFHVLEKFRLTARTAFLFNTQCNSREFLHYLITELGYECPSRNFVTMLDEFNQNLIRDARLGKRCIVVIDEAQNFDHSVLETARLLSNFETSRAKLVQIILAGQPELADKLASPCQTQLRQRISMFSRLNPFTDEDTLAYIRHCLQTAGYSGPSLFTEAALEFIAAKAEGIPRNINILCFASLSLGCAARAKIIDLSLVQEASADLDVGQLGSHVQDVTRTSHPVPMTFSDLLRGAKPVLNVEPVSNGATSANEVETALVSPAEEVISAEENAKAEVLQPGDAVEEEHRSVAGAILDCLEHDAHGEVREESNRPEIQGEVVRHLSTRHWFSVPNLYLLLGAGALCIASLYQPIKIHSNQASSLPRIVAADDVSNPPNAGRRSLPEAEPGPQAEDGKASRPQHIPAAAASPSSRDAKAVGAAPKTGSPNNQKNSTEGNTNE